MNLRLPNCRYGVVLPSGEYAALRWPGNGSPEAIQTHAGDVALPNGEAVLYLDARIVAGVFEFGGQGAQSGIAWVHGGGNWLTLGSTFGVWPVLFTRDAVNVIVDGHRYERFADLGPLSLVDIGFEQTDGFRAELQDGSIVFGRNSLQDPARGLCEFTDYGDVAIGQGVDGGMVVRFADDGKLRALATGRCLMPKIHRSGDTFGIAFHQPDTVEMVLRVMTLAELRASPELTAPSIPPLVVADYDFPIYTASFKAVANYFPPGSTKGYDSPFACEILENVWGKMPRPKPVIAAYRAGPYDGEYVYCAETVPTQFLRGVFVSTEANQDVDEQEWAGAVALCLQRGVPLIWNQDAIDWRSPDGQRKLASRPRPAGLELIPMKDLYARKVNGLTLSLEKTVAGWLADMDYLRERFPRLSVAVATYTQSDNFALDHICALLPFADEIVREYRVFLAACFCYARKSGATTYPELMQACEAIAHATTAGEPARLVLPTPTPIPVPNPPAPTPVPVPVPPKETPVSETRDQKIERLALVAFAAHPALTLAEAGQAVVSCFDHMGEAGVHRDPTDLELMLFAESRQTEKFAPPFLPSVAGKDKWAPAFQAWIKARG